MRYFVYFINSKQGYFFGRYMLPTQKGKVKSKEDVMREIASKLRVCEPSMMVAEVGHFVHDQMFWSNLDEVPPCAISSESQAKDEMERIRRMSE